MGKWKFKSLMAIGLLAGGLSSFNANAFVLQGNSWGGPGTTVTWSLMPTGTPCALPPVEPVGCTITSITDFMPVGAVTEIVNAFAAWSAVADINFVKINDDGAPFNAPTSSGDIRIGGHAFDGPGNTLAHGFFPPPNGLSAAGDIHFDIADTWKIGFGGAGFDIFQVMAHEIGHAIGLEHTAVPNSLLNPFYTEAFRGLQADDIAGAQALYGARQSVFEPETTLLMMLSFAMLALSLRRKENNLQPELS
ncbi:hypothetical protein C9I98_08170 [Photobacterium sanctipauli]|uniref:Peptidase metallopeptidase domain-containing protein n=1 Tax=Photobacterium sanctipauli TaxID=1342794 RepID=A0A2T3NWZ4_9GAMM|nr:matrixin family metalloprotease [Photobacterium sanctipauli]PSW20804.1 hypothetical protein C9I98_08170 [Photobacterium sanctipauli]